MRKREMKTHLFTKFRIEVYSWIHDKKRTLDELIYAWDFFNEHKVVCEHIIDQKINAILKRKQKRRRKK